MNRRLIIFAREPQLGRVKTRLAPVLGEQAALNIYTEMLADVLDLAGQLKDVAITLYWASESENVAVPVGFPALRTARQQGDDLGTRMRDAFERCFADGGELCCIIGSDSPDLPVEYIQQGYRALEDGADVVFGPSDDGGYYLLGLRRVWPTLFEDLPWSTAEVLPISQARAGELGLRVAMLPEWYDIDTAADLERFCLASATAAPRTRRALLKAPAGVNGP